MDNIYAIIPVSKFTDAKTRLSPFLSANEREELLKAMLKDVTKTLKKLVDKIIIISRDSDDDFKRLLEEHDEISYLDIEDLGFE